MNRKKVLCVIGAIIVGIVVGCGVYEVSAYFGKTDDVDNANNNLENNEENIDIKNDNIVDKKDVVDNEIEEDKVNIYTLNNIVKNSEKSDEIYNLGERLFDKTLGNYKLDDYYMYQKGIITNDTMENELKLRMTYEMTNGKSFEDTYYDIFGTRDIKYEQFGIDVCSYCYFENNQMNCVDREVYCGDDTEWRTFLKYESAVQQNGNIILDVYYLKAVYGAATDKGVPLVGSPDKEYNVLYLTVEEADILYKVDELFKKYEAKAGKFKVTFKPNDTGGYYWYSSEFVD